MSVSIAEYLGQRTDVGTPNIVPVQDRSDIPCPFMSASCDKVRKGYKPVCSVRNTGGTLWIVCRHRLCSTSKSIPLVDYQREKLLTVAKSIFSHEISPEHVLIRREVSMHVVGRSRYHADFIMLNDAPPRTPHGPSKVVLEMQGGGETSNTGQISDKVRQWESESRRTNIILSEPVNAGTIETNAWRRQQEQFLIKGRIAMQTGTGHGMVLCVGTLLYDYLWSRIQNTTFRDLREHNWTLALLCFKEDDGQTPSEGPIPLILDTSRMLFTDFQAFVRTLTDQGSPSPESFIGEFDTLAGTTKTIS